MDQFDKKTTDFFYLQVGSTDAEDASPCLEQHAEDLREPADMLAEKGFRLAYENWCWAT